MTVHTETKASGAIGEAMRKDGQPLGANTTRYRTCRDLAEWKQNLATAERGPANCLTSKRSETQKGLTGSYACAGSTLRAKIESSVSWPTDQRIDMSFHMVTTYTNMSGESVFTNRTTSRFISADCGGIAIGKPVVVK